MAGRTIEGRGRDFYYDDLSLACAAEATARLEATPVDDVDIDVLYESWWNIPDADAIVGITDVAGGCLITQPCSLKAKSFRAVRLFVLESGDYEGSTTSAIHIAQHQARFWDSVPPEIVKLIRRKTASTRGFTLVDHRGEGSARDQ
ncbi:hypothetical protein ACIBO2_49615 [Nonomuraea sp. NPDC050022]|uniref:hypothetical protein n=1 Tax=Nonomuraea sp. NPDC050022 TaxID=3364358 RepID=UPI0037928433